MKRMILVALAVAVGSGATPLFAQQCEPTPGEKFKQSFFDNLMWPSQYIYAARTGVKQPFAVMVNNGWRRQCLLGPHHFDEQNEALSESGRLKTEWILTQAPPNRRNIYVQQGRNESQTNVRVQAVHEFAAADLPQVVPGSVTPTMLRERGRPAAIIDQAFTGFAENQPVPMLPQGSTTGVGN